MTGWLIFFGIILFILGILRVPVHAVAEYKKSFSLKIKLLFFFKMQIIPEKEKKKKEEKPKQQKQKEETEKPQKQKQKMTPEEIIDMIIDAVNKYGPGAKMILRNIRFHRLELYWKIGAEDAAACGIKYGRACAWLSGVLGFFRNFTKIEKAKIRVFPDFICEKDEAYGGADIEFNPLVVLIGALRIGFVFIKDMFEKSKKQTKNHAAKPQKNINAKESA